MHKKTNTDGCMDRAKTDGCMDRANTDGCMDRANIGRCKAMCMCNYNSVFPSFNAKGVYNCIIRECLPRNNSFKTKAANISILIYNLTIVGKPKQINALS